MYKLVDLCSL